MMPVCVWARSGIASIHHNMIGICVSTFNWMSAYLLCAHCVLTLVWSCYIILPPPPPPFVYMYGRLADPYYYAEQFPYGMDENSRENLVTIIK